MRKWNWNLNEAKEGPLYEVLTAEYCSLYKRVLVHRNIARLDSRHRWRYTGWGDVYIEDTDTTIVVAFRTAEVSDPLMTAAIQAYHLKKKERDKQS